MKPLHERRRRSARESFANCRYKYKAEHMDDLVTESNATRRGNAFHAAVEIYIGKKLWPSRLEADHELAAEAIAEACILWPLPWEEWQDVRQLWARFTENYTLNLDTFYSVEAPMRSQFGADLRLDEVHVPAPDTIRAIDYKTWWRIPSQAEMAQSFQSQFYLSAMRHVFPGFRNYELVYDIPRYGVQSDVITQTEAEADEFAQFIQEQDEAIDIAETSNAYPATPGSHCRFCVARCPLADHQSGSLRRVVEREEARTVVERLAVLNRESESLAFLLKGFAEKHGAVESGGIEWAFRPTERHVYPARQVLDVLEETGTEFKLTVSGSAVKPLLTSKRKYAHIADQIKALAQTKVTTKFYPKRVSGLDDERAYEADDDGADT